MYVHMCVIMSKYIEYTNSYIIMGLRNKKFTSCPFHDQQ